MEKNKKRVIASIVTNGFIFVATIVCLIYGMIGDTTSVFEYKTTGLAVFKFFTVQSNVLMGVFAAVFAVYGVALLLGSIKSIPKIIYAVKLALTTGVLLTFFTVVFVLAPVAPQGYFSLFVGTNFFYHFLLPVVAAVTFLCFEATDGIPLWQTLFSLVHTLVFGAGYMINLFAHMEGGAVSVRYDFYGFYQNGPVWYAITLVLMVAFTYLLGWLLWIIGGKIAARREK